MVHVSTLNFCLEKLFKIEFKMFFCLLSKHLKEVPRHSQDWQKRCAIVRCLFAPVPQYLYKYSQLSNGGCDSNWPPLPTYLYDIPCPLLCPVTIKKEALSNTVATSVLLMAHLHVFAVWCSTVFNSLKYLWCKFTGVFSVMQRNIYCI